MEGSLAHVRAMGEQMVEKQKKIRHLITEAATSQDTADLDIMRALVAKITALRHEMDEIQVDTDIIEAAVKRIVIPQNAEAFLQLTFRPLSLRPHQWPGAFVRNGAGLLYPREDKTNVSATIQTFESLFPAQVAYTAALKEQMAFEGGAPDTHFVKYAGETSA
ncbi:hypothetical protein OC845_006871 [Tilletia horrida]|nr:hypothetical protein OC845_006871 [Tilletia horrida]